jgi:hypothetical protein
VPWAWRTYRECLRSLGDEPGIIVQDDGRLCDDFKALAEAAVQECPCRVLCLFVSGRLRLGGHMVLQAATAGLSFARLHSQDHYVPLVAVAWPPGVAREVLAWADSVRLRPGQADDGIVAGARDALGLEIWATVPCLVDHTDEPSLVGNKGRRGAVLPHPSLA